VPLEDASRVNPVACESVGKLVLDLIVPAVARRTDEVAGSSGRLRPIHVGLLEPVLVKALLGELVSLVFRPGAFDPTDTEAEIAFVVRRELDIKLDDVTLRIGGLGRPIVVVDATGLVLPRFWHGVRVSAEAMEARRIYGPWPSGGETLRAVIRVHHDIPRGWFGQKSVTHSGWGRCEEQRGDVGGGRHTGLEDAVREVRTRLSRSTEI
jgi:hypothetical protein